MKKLILFICGVLLVCSSFISTAAPWLEIRVKNGTGDKHTVSILYNDPSLGWQFYAPPNPIDPYTTTPFYIQVGGATLLNLRVYACPSTSPDANVSDPNGISGQSDYVGCLLDPQTDLVYWTNTSQPQNYPYLIVEFSLDP